MFDIGGMEILVVAVAILVIFDPRDLPLIFKRVGYFYGQCREVIHTLSAELQNAAEVAERGSGYNPAEDPIFADRYAIHYPEDAEEK